MILIRLSQLNDLNWSYSKNVHQMISIKLTSSTDQLNLKSHFKVDTQTNLIRLLINFKMNIRVWAVLISLILISQWSLTK